jgi:hypothetical protein
VTPCFRRLVCMLISSMVGLVSAAGCQSTSTPKSGPTTGWNPPPANSSSSKHSWNPFHEEPKAPKTPSDFVGMQRPE